MNNIEAIRVFHNGVDAFLGWLGPKRWVEQDGQECVELFVSADMMSVRVTLSIYEHTVFTDIGPPVTRADQLKDWLPMGVVFREVLRPSRSSNAMFSTSESLLAVIKHISEELSELANVARVRNHESIVDMYHAIMRNRKSRA